MALQTIIAGPTTVNPTADYIQETINATPTKSIHLFGKGDYQFRVVTFLHGVAAWTRITFATASAVPVADQIKSTVQITPTVITVVSSFGSGRYLLRGLAREVIPVSLTFKTDKITGGVLQAVQTSLSGGISTDDNGVVTIQPSGLPTTGLNITQHFGAITTDADAATITFDLSVSDWHQTAALGGNRTLALANPTVGQQFTLVIKQAASGGPYTPVWFSGITWIGAPYAAPAMPTTASALLTATFKCMGSGVYLGWWLGNSAA